MMFRNTEKEAQCRKLAVFSLSIPMKASSQYDKYNIRNSLFKCLADLEQRNSYPGSYPGKPWSEIWTQCKSLACKSLGRHAPLYKPLHREITSTAGNVVL